ncbi:sensor histidine kinase [Fluviicola sp.]|uniref:sensor histidine kinase n=1 Tax=Fluviicola sp. TaxID=1917219 RepID=UPI0026212513|nr:sensor histidine kinase [Fluviicola sp.]
MFYRFLLLLTVFNLSALNAFTQISYDHYTVNDGLPSQTVYYAIQDKQGFLWLSTDAGVSRFDGKKFTNFTTEDGLAEDEILAMYEDNKGRIWFFPFSKKISYYYNGKFYSEKNDPMIKQLPDQYLGYTFSFAEDAFGNIYIPSVKRELIKVDLQNKITRYRIPGDISCIYPSIDRKRIFCVTSATVIKQGEIFELSSSGNFRKIPDTALDNQWKNRIWYTNPVSTAILYSVRNKLYRIDELKPTYLLSFEYIPGREQFNWFNKDRYSNIWRSDLMGQNLLYRRTGNTYQKPVNILPDKPAFICFDKENNIWLLTKAEGIYKIPYSRLSNQLEFEINTRSKGKHLLSSCITDDGILWLGYTNGYLSCFSKNETKHYDLGIYSALNNRVLQIKQDQDGNIWIITDRLILLVKKKSTGVYTEPIEIRNKNGERIGANKGIYFDPLGNTFLTCPAFPTLKLNKQLMAFERVNKKFGNPFGRVFSNYIDSRGRSYQSSIKGFGLFLDESHEVFKNLSVNEPRLKVRVQHYAENSRGALFLATYSDGLIAMKDNKLITTFKRSDGLAGSICKRIYCIRDTIYVATNGGISILSFQNNRFRLLLNVKQDKGLISNDVNDLSFRDHFMYAATTEGLSILHLPIRNLASSKPPILSIQRIRSGKTELDPGKKFVLPYNQDKGITIGYIAPVMDKPQLVQYRYRFTGNEKEWQITASNELEFSGLPFGKYALEIQAKKYNSNWGQSKVIRFTITPPFYYSNWFLLLSIFFGITLLILTFRFILKRRVQHQLLAMREREAVEKERMRISADIHDDIGSEITSIIILSKTLRDQRSATSIDSLLDKLETSSHEVINKMNEVIWTLNSSNDTLHNLLAYIRNYISQFSEKHDLNTSLEMEDSLYRDTPMSAEQRRSIFLLVKEILHNVVKHAHAGQLLITISESSHTLLIKVCDNGKGFNTDSDTQGNGLRNMSKRIDTLKGKLSITSEIDKGTCIQIELPI